MPRRSQARSLGEGERMTRGERNRRLCELRRKLRRSSAAVATSREGHHSPRLGREQQSQLKDILRLIPPDERAAFLAMLQHELHGRELPNDELRRVAEHTWRAQFVQHPAG